MKASMREATVTFKDGPGGLLELKDDGRSRFRYDDACATDIACGLPRSQREHIWARGLHPFFQHLGAEGWLRDGQARAEGTDTEDDLGLLLAYGADCIGAVGVQRVGGAAPASASLVGPGVDPAIRAATATHRTLSGVQRKLLVYRGDDGSIRPASDVTPAPFIAKLNSATLATLVRNEHLTLALARDALGKQAVTQSELATVDGLEEPALLVHRFDRTAAGAKLRLEDFAQILARPRLRDNRGKYDGAYEEIAEGLRRHSASPAIDIDRFFRLVVFCAAVGNCDAHLKNFSLLEDRVGRLRLSPAYDLLATAIYPGYSTKFALRMLDEEHTIDAIEARLLTAFGRAIGLPLPAVRLALSEVGKGMAASRSLEVPAGAAPDDFRSLYVASIRANCARLFDT